MCHFHTHTKHTDSKSKTMRIPTRSTPFCWGIFTSVSMEASYLLVSTWRILPTPLIRGLYDHHGPMVILSTETIHVGMILQVGALPQWLFLVPSIGGRYHIIPQLAVYTTYIPLIYIYNIYILYIYIWPIGWIIWYLPPIKGTRNNHWSNLGVSPPETPTETCMLRRRFVQRWASRSQLIEQKQP